MRNRHTLSILVTIWLIVNNLGPFSRKVRVNIEADNINADSAEGAYHVAQAVTSAIFQAMLFALTNDSNEGAVRTLDLKIEAEAGTHTGKLARTVFPMDTAAETGSEPAAICAYSREVSRHIGRCMNDIHAGTAELLKILAAAYFEDTDGEEGNGYAVTRRGLPPES